MTQRMWRSDLRAGPFAKLRRRGRGRIQPVETHQQEVLEENDHVLTVGGDRVSLEEVVDNAGKERGALHVEGHGIESCHVAVHHNLENLGKLHDGRPDDDSVAKALAYRVLQTRNVHEIALHKECTITLGSDHVGND